MGAAWGIVFTPTAFLAGRVSDRIGRKPVLMTSAALSALAALLFLRATNVLELVAIRGLEGLAWACFWPPMEALATETAENARVGRGIGAVTTVYAVAFSASSFAAGLVTSLFGFTTVFAGYLVVASLAVAAAGIVQMPKRLMSQENSVSSTFRSRLASRTSVAWNLLGASYTFGLATIMALLSVYAARIGIEVLSIGTALAVFWAGRIVGAAFAGGTSDRYGRRLIATLALLLGCVGFVMIGSAIEFALLTGGVLLAGLSVGAVFPVNVAMIADGVEPRLRGEAMGFYEMICAIAFMAAAAVGGAAAENVSPNSPYWLSAVVYISCSAVLLVLLPRRERGPAGS
jgi:MFS family permease